MKATLQWVPANAHGSRWELMLTLDWPLRIAVVHRSGSGGWEVPVSGGSYLYARKDFDKAVDCAERDGLGRYGLTPPAGWRIDRVAGRRPRCPGAVVCNRTGCHGCADGAA